MGKEMSLFAFSKLDPPPPACRCDIAVFSAPPLHSPMALHTIAHPCWPSYALCAHVHSPIHMHTRSNTCMHTCTHINPHTAAQPTSSLWILDQDVTLVILQNHTAFRPHSQPFLAIYHMRSFLPPRCTPTPGTLVCQPPQIRLY